ncbi:MAG: prepilin-type N-terminal cleavage/methylation domain-containing protein [Clostridiales bacterium]|nr:prepilin-type N-terminal cleavage/methylation domain-containing protein [Clostridiales bacterium]
MIKKGFTLIETLMSIFLLSIILSIGISGYNFFQKRIDEITSDISIYDITEILSYGKEYSYSHNVSGKYSIKINNGRYVVSYISADGEIVKKELDKDIKLFNKSYENEIQGKEISISEKGYVESDSFYFKDKIGEEYKLSIRPGGNLITIKGGSED